MLNLKDILVRSAFAVMHKAGFSFVIEFSAGEASPASFVIFSRNSNHSLDRYFVQKIDTLFDELGRLKP